MKWMGRGVFKFTVPVYLKSWACATGPKENAGPLCGKFDFSGKDCKMGEKTWEKSESFLQKTALRVALKKSGIKETNLDLILGGDLLNQCTATSYTMRDVNIPFAGIFGACSTFAEGMILGGIIESAAYSCEDKIEIQPHNIGIIASSHFCSAERQFRFPLNYGGQRTPTAQWTATAAGCAVITDERVYPNSGHCEGKFKIKITGGIIGCVSDMAIKDAGNMGAAMAYSAYKSISEYLEKTKSSPIDYDYIVTGDLGKVGGGILRELFDKDGVNTENFADCGEMLFNIEEQDVHSGASGCGCSAAVMCAEFFPKMASGEYARILFGGTGALMSPTSSAQGDSIPGICHAVELNIEQ